MILNTFCLTMFKGGRPAHPIWEYFFRITLHGKQQAKCKLCGHLQAPRPERMASHQLNCVKVHKDISDTEAATSATATRKRPRSPSTERLPVNKMCLKIIYVFQSKEKYRIEYTS